MISMFRSWLGYGPAETAREEAKRACVAVHSYSRSITRLIRAGQQAPAQAANGDGGVTFTVVVDDE